MSSIGIVIIGRNEGARLAAAIESVRAHAPASSPIVYVDSGSTDGSVTLARAAGCSVVELDLKTPFTAARARNEGAARLLELCPDLPHLFFMDGDCRLCEAFLPGALDMLGRDPKIAVVCGRRLEVRPTRNVFHRLAAMEWNTPPGPTDACGGDALFRFPVFSSVGGFDPKVIAGEEPELCVRIRAAGHTIHRLDADMTLHDVDMTRFSQWWKRSVRAGFAFANGAAMHGASPNRHWLRPALRTWFWALLLPLCAIACSYPTRGCSLLLLLAYLKPLHGAFVARRRRGDSRGDAALYSASCLLAKFAELQGQIRFLILRITRRQAAIIEYKSVSAPPSTPPPTPPSAHTFS